MASNTSNSLWAGSHVRIRNVRNTININNQVTTESEHEFVVYNRTDQDRSFEFEYAHKLFRQTASGAYDEHVDHDTIFGSFDVDKIENGVVQDYDHLDLQQEQGVAPIRQISNAQLVPGGNYELTAYTLIKPPPDDRDDEWGDDIKVERVIQFSCPDPD